MEISQSALARLFFYAFFTGILLGAFYDALRLSRVLLGREETPRTQAIRARIHLPLLPPQKERRTRRHCGILLFLEDFLFCILGGIFIILLFYEWNRGIIRIPALLCVVLGFVCYRCTLGRIVVRISDLLAFAIGVLLRYAFFFLCFPVRWLWGTLKKGASALIGCVCTRYRAHARRRMTAAEQKRLQREDVGACFGFSKKRSDTTKRRTTVATEQKKKQFTLSLTMRIFLVALILISIGIFAGSVMYYNQLNQEAEELQAALTALHETRDELNELLGSAEEVNRLLDDRAAYEEIINSGNEAGDVLIEYQNRLEEINRLLNSSKNRDYIVKIAREELGLYFADEEIFYNDMNK